MGTVEDHRSPSATRGPRGLGACGSRSDPVAALRGTVLPRAVSVAVLDPAPRVFLPQLEQLLCELAGEEQVAEELAAGRVSRGPGETAEEEEVTRPAEPSQAGVALPVDLARDLADPVRRARCDEDVGDEAALAVRAHFEAARRQRLVDRRERLDVVNERVHEQALNELACAVEEVRSATTRDRRAERVEANYDHALGTELARRLDRRVEAGAAVEVPALVGLRNVDGGERYRNRGRRSHVVFADRRPDIVDAAAVVARRVG